MQEAEKIQGKSRFKLFEQLLRDKTLMKMYLLGKDYERLSIVVGIRTKKGIPYFLIDYPRGFKEAVAGVEVWKIRFEFIGKDKVPYIFRTSGGEISGDEIWVRFPEVIERIQRRQYFRLDAPLGTRIHVMINSIKHEMTVINVSQSGALVSFEKGKQRNPILQSGEYLRHLVLVFQSDEEVLKVYIKEGLVKRLEKNTLTDRYRYGLQFTDFKRKEENRLRDLIYKFQRKSLRKKELIDN